MRKVLFVLTAVASAASVQGCGNNAPTSYAQPGLGYTTPYAAANYMNPYMRYQYPTLNTAAYTPNLAVNAAGLNGGCPVSSTPYYTGNQLAGCKVREKLIDGNYTDVPTTFQLSVGVRAGDRLYFNLKHVQIQVTEYECTGATLTGSSIYTLKPKVFTAVLPDGSYNGSQLSSSLPINVSKNGSLSLQADLSALQVSCSDGSMSTAVNSINIRFPGLGAVELERCVGTDGKQVQCI